jgi:tetratricopeptide (TPR) repeat protein
MVEAIHRETDGNPFFAGEILKLLAAEGRLEDVPDAQLPIPPSVRDAIRARLGRLSEACVGALVLAAVLGREFDLEALARAGGRDLEALLDVLDEAIGSGLVVEVPGARGRLRFVHVLVRDTLYDELPATRRLRLHRDVAEALEGLYERDPEPYLAELAHHFGLAVPVADADTAARYATRAGDRAALLLAYEEAARLYVAALELVDDAAGSSELLLRLGDVQARQGDITASKETLVRAADVARAADLPEHLARAALGYGGRFVWARAWGDERLVPLLEEALAALPEQDGELRARLLARLAGGPYRDTHAPGPRERIAQQAVDMARRLGHPDTLAYTLEGRYDANWGPDALDGRLAIADELLALAAAVGDAERAYAGHDCRFIAMLEAGNLVEARRSHEAGARIADRLRQPAQLWDSAARRALLALYDGRLAEAESLTREAYAVGRSVQTVNAQLVLDLQLYAIRREQGRLPEVLDVVERAVDDYPGYPVWRYVLIDVLAELGRTTDARTELARAGVEGYPVYLEMQWLFSMTLLGDVCCALEDADTAEVVYARLLPYARFNAVLPPELCFGSVSRALGNLAATADRRDDAVRHLEDALAMNAAGGSGTWLAHTQHDLARTLLERDGGGDRARADDLLAAAKASAEAMGLRALAARIP